MDIRFYTQPFYRFGDRTCGYFSHIDPSHFAKLTSPFSIYASPLFVKENFPCLCNGVSFSLAYPVVLGEAEGLRHPYAPRAEDSSLPLIQKDTASAKRRLCLWQGQKD